MDYVLIAIVVAVVFVFTILYSLFKRYKRCPSDQILVVYGKVGKGPDGSHSAKCIHGGAAFIWPVIQDYSFMDLTPISIEVNLTNALSRQNIRVDVPSRFTVAISTEPGVMTNAAERLLGLQRPAIHDLAKDIIFGQLRLVVATMDIEEINNNRDKFLANVASNVEAEIKKIGMKLINVNVTDIKEESGYIEALGKEAAAKAINEAKKSVAEQEKIGEIGKAEADREKDITIQTTLKNRDVSIAETQRDRDTMIAQANKDKSILIAAANRDESMVKRKRKGIPVSNNPKRTPSPWKGKPGAYQDRAVGSRKKGKRGGSRETRHSSGKDTGRESAGRSLPRREKSGRCASRQGKGIPERQHRGKR